MKRINIRRSIMVSFIIVCCGFISGCIPTAWVRDTKQARGSWYGILPAQEAVRMEGEILKNDKDLIKNDFDRERFNNVLEKERMLNAYVKRQLENNSNTPAIQPQKSAGLGFQGIVKNLSSYNRYQFVITSLDSPGLGNSYYLNPLEEITPNLQPGRYECTAYKDGVKWGSGSRFVIDGRKPIFLGKEVFWFCYRE